MKVSSVPRRMVTPIVKEQKDEVFLALEAKSETPPVEIRTLETTSPNVKIEEKSTQLRLLRQRYSWEIQH